MGWGVNSDIAKGGGAGGEFAGVGVGSQLGLEEGACVGETQESCGTAVTEKFQGPAQASVKHS